ncbi:hypothetical protein [Planosporangium mesophilum]|uniref:Uncharacterized protein n=1 Tax=Planosporangium mesophilum TaxID=689768 RepID=A0A8J3TDB2_9ACTN|nr:hypothetical protein [Planosporangium mesophilum]NJC84778.1 hypothetical protein [Planosporangium mesophilum]GII24204.1 hypothetical protein Pme01_38010 [Planosporangium mesophilum]
MTRSRRLYALALSCVVAATALLLVGVRAWAKETVHRTDSRCSRPAVIATAPGRPAVAPVSAPSGRPALAPVGPAITHRPAATGQRPEPRSWRAHTLRVAGCGAWREVHDRIRHHQGSHRGA